MSKFFNSVNYNNCIANLANSVLVSFGAEANGDTLPMADRFLAGNHKNVVIFLLDGMGMSVIESNLEEDGFFRSHLAGSYDSVFPPTTVAATTSVLSGLMPCEHSLLGWDCYFPELDRNVSIFPNTVQGTDRSAAEYDVGQRFAPYENVIDRINRAGGKAYFATPFYPPYPETLEEMCARIAELCAQPDRKYIYAYYNEPDTTMHRTGAHSTEAKLMLRGLEKRLNDLAESLDDTLFIITANHSHIDVRGENIDDYPKVTECLERAPSIEPRAASFFVKPGRNEQFEVEFNKVFGDDFLLLTRQHIVDSQLFGTGREHEHFCDRIGDYIALAIKDVCIFRSDRDVKRYKGHHAGFTEEEIVIPFIVIEK